MADRTIKTLHPFLRENDTRASSGGAVKSYSHDTGSGPVLCLVHGWPQSSYTWRHVVPALKEHISLFIVELPGYGTSSLPASPDKRTVGNLIVDALQHVFGKDRAILWCGHDRGARIGHRLAVDDNDAHNIRAAVLMDIVPTLEQWRAFSNPAAGKAYWHWPFLATPFAPALIEAMGGGTLVQTILQKSKGGNAAGTESFKKDDAIAHYCHQFNNPECIAGSCADYASASADEPAEQERDQREGKKMKIPVMVIYAADGLGKMHDIPSVWPSWVDGEVRFEGIGDGYGHYLQEECPEKVTKLLIEWIGQHGK